MSRPRVSFVRGGKKEVICSGSPPLKFVKVNKLYPWIEILIASSPLCFKGKLYDRESVLSRTKDASEMIPLLVANLEYAKLAS